MKVMNIIWAAGVYFVGNVVLYRRDWSELRERRDIKFAGSGRSGTKTAIFDVAKKQPFSFKTDAPRINLGAKPEDNKRKLELLVKGD